MNNLSTSAQAESKKQQYNEPKNNLDLHYIILVSLLLLIVVINLASTISILF